MSLPEKMESTLGSKVFYDASFGDERTGKRHLLVRGEHYHRGLEGEVLTCGVVSAATAGKTVKRPDMIFVRVH